MTKKPSHWSSLLFSRLKRLRPQSLIAFLLLISLVSFRNVHVRDHAFTLLLTETFETDGDGTRYQANFFSDRQDVFTRFNLTNFPEGPYQVSGTDYNFFSTYSGHEGNFVLGGEDLDEFPENPLSVGADGGHVYIVLQTVDISAYQGGTAKVELLLGANSAEPLRYETDDFIKIEYAFDADITTGANTVGAVPANDTDIDDGTYAIAGAFYGDDSDPLDDSGEWLEDTDLDGSSADESGPKLGNVLTDHDFTFSVPAGAEKVSVRIHIATTDGSEEVIVDNIRISAEEGSTATVLSAGEMAIASASSDSPDAFSFVSFVNIAANTTVFFTDKGWDANGGTFQTTGASDEGIIQWSSTSSLVAGTEVVITNADNGSIAASVGTATRSSGDFDLSADGDQVIIFQGTEASPTFVYAFNFDGNGYVSSPGSDATNSGVPNGLTEGTNAYLTSSHVDNWRYRCSANATALIQYMQDFNYESSDATGFTSGVGSDTNCLTGPNQVPSASAVSFSGILKTSATLTGAYTYADGDGDLESGSTYQWHRSDDISGTNKSAISGAINQFYVPQDDDATKFLSFEVIPMDGKQPGNAVESAIQGPIVALPADGSFVSLLTESFETDGQGTRYRFNDFLDGFDYFTRFDLVTNPQGLSSSSFFADYSGSDGNFVLGGEDLDEFPENPLSVGADGGHVYVVFKTVDVTSYRDGTAKVQLLLGANSAEPLRYETDDFIKIEYAFDSDIATGANSAGGIPTAVANVDDGTYSISGAFYGDDSDPGDDSGEWLEDTDLDGISSDEIGTKLSQTLSDHTFTFPIPSGASNMSIRVHIATTDGSEEVIIDNVRISAANNAPTTATVAASVFLEGAYNGTDLNTTLNPSIPTTQPYNRNGHSGGIAPSIPANAVDWVLVELREAGSAAGALSTTKVGSVAGFLMKDGSIKATDGTSDLTVALTGNTGSDFYVVIYHRNHLPIMSANAISETGGTYSIDFTSISANTYQTTTALATLSTGKFAMPAGDADGDGDVDATDLITWRAQNGIAFSYNNTNGDFNLDGVINAVDRNEFQRKNATKTSQVPGT